MGPDEFSGFELADYEESIQSAITASLKGSGGDLMPYFSEQRNPGVKAKVLSAIPSVELRGGELMGCTTVRLKKPLDKVEMSALQEYLLGQFSDGWGEGFEQREIQTADGVLYVHFWSEESFSFEVVPVQAAEPAKRAACSQAPQNEADGHGRKHLFHSWQGRPPAAGKRPAGTGQRDDEPGLSIGGLPRGSQHYQRVCGELSEKTLPKHKKRSNPER